MDVSELTDNVLRLTIALADQMQTIRKLEARIVEIEKVKTESISISPKFKLLNPEEAISLFWLCSPRQHALIQLVVVLGFRNQDLADRLGITLSSVKTRFRHMCGRLSIKGRADLEANYKPIFESIDDDQYQESARITKEWAREYGKLSYEQAKKDDPYFKDICETHYRGVAMKGREMK
ncbi:MAG: hypothetical protein RPT25_11630 [Cycloclasticus sp.]